jgi:hypothetical protein
MAASSTIALAAGATLVAAAFTVAIGDRWATRRRPHELAWTVSLALFTLASAALWIGVATGWTAGSFRAFYLFGAILNVPWLALGSVLLLNGGKRAAGLLRGFGLGSAFIAGLMIYAPLKAKVPADDLPVGKDLFGVVPRVLAAAGSGVAATIIVVLALWSAWRLWRGRDRDPERSRATGSVPSGRLVLGNVLIALGTFVLSASGTVAGRLGKTNAFAITLALGIVVLFAGFVVATGNPGMATRSPRQAAMHLALSAG